MGQVYKIQKTTTKKPPKSEAKIQGTQQKKKKLLSYHALKAITFRGDGPEHDATLLILAIRWHANIVPNFDGVETKLGH